MTCDEMRALFPSAQKCIHLNHAGTSPTSRPVGEAVQTVLDELMSADVFAAYRGQMKRQETLRSAFGRMMNVSPSTLAFTRNTSHGIAIAAQAIPFQPGDVVVVAENEYPANVYPWMAQGDRGVTVRLVKPREGGYVAEEDLMAACMEAGDKARVLAVSWVQWGTGQRMDLARLSTFCRERSILLLADVVQGLGALRLDLSALPVDIAAAGCHKWLLTPGGQGILYVRENLMPHLRFTNIGWNAVQEPIDWERLHFDDLKPTADRFEEGTPALLATAALLASVEVLEAVGFDAVERRVLALADHARALLHDRGLTLMSPDAPGKTSGIIAFRHPTHSNEAVENSLKAAGVIAAVRCGNVRFSPHAYNTEAELEEAVAALPA